MHHHCVGQAGSVQRFEGWAGTHELVLTFSEPGVLILHVLVTWVQFSTLQTGMVVPEYAGEYISQLCPGLSGVEFRLGHIPHIALVICGLVRKNICWFQLRVQNLCDCLGNDTVL